MNAGGFVKEVWKSIEDRLRLIEARNTEPSPTTPIIDETYTGPGLIPGPGVPNSYQGPEQEAKVFPRLFDYNFMSNLQIVPRAEFPEVASMAQLQFSYYETDDIQVAANWRIDRLLGVDHDVEVKSGSKSSDGGKELEAAKRLVEYPDPKRDWDYQQWARVVFLCETITDSTTIYPLKTYGGDTVALQVVDGRTIKPIMDYDGAFPLPPEPALQQFIKGYPNRKWSMDDMGYFPSRPRPNMLYGESRVEQIMKVARTTRNHLRYTDEWYTEGNIPEAILSMPLEYFQGQGATVAKRVKDLQIALDEMSGPNKARRRLFLAPLPLDKAQPMKVNEFNKDLPDWLVRRICVRFGCPANLFVTETNRATATQVSKDTHDADFNSSLKWFESLMNRCLARAGFSNVEFKFYPLQNFEMVHVQGVNLAASTPLPVTAENPLGLPAITRREYRDALGCATLDEENNNDELAPQEATTPNAPANQPQAQAPGKVLPMRTKGQLPVTRSRAAQVRFNTERAAHVSHYMDSIKPILADKQKKAEEAARRAAAQRGKKVI